MNPCQNCGKINTAETNFCRFCGTKFMMGGAIPVNPYDHSAPTPYGWKTDEFQTQNEARRTIPIDETRPIPARAPASPPQYRPAPLAAQNPAGQFAGPMTPKGNYAMDVNYRCPNCGCSYLPVIERRISTAGWIVFATLLLFTFIFFWVGLLMKEEVAVCPVCRLKMS